LNYDVDAMASVGEKLRHERELRGASLDETARNTGIGRTFLEALEAERFDALPGRAFGKLYIRAYAELFGFDADPLLADYERTLSVRRRESRPRSSPRPSEGEAARDGASRVRRRRRVFRPEPEEPTRATGPPGAELAEPPQATRSAQGSREVDPPDGARAAPAAPAAPAEDDEREPLAVAPSTATALEPESAVDASPGEVAPPAGQAGLSRRSARFRVRPTLAVATCALALLLLIPLLRRPDDRVGGPRVAAPSAAAPSATGRLETGEPAAPAQVEEDPAVEDAALSPPPVESHTAAPSPATAGKPLRVDEFGTGTGVVSNRLRGRSDTFTEGTVAWFSTKVVGGTAGRRIRHVWLHEGQAIQSIELPIGGPHWRTHSNKTLWGTGEWTVEARDEAGHLLARQRFTCLPRGS
jgi:cytoskeletal protein RodZ